MEFPKAFVILRHEDVSGVSGVGVVAWGTLFPDGAVTVRWVGAHPSTVAWPTIGDVVAVHGHDGRSELVWEGDEPATIPGIGPLTPLRLPG